MLHGRMTCSMFERLAIGRSFLGTHTHPMPIPNVPLSTQRALLVVGHIESLVRYVPLTTCTSHADVQLSSLWDLVRVSTELRRTRVTRQINSKSSSQDLVQTEQPSNLPQRANKWGQSHRNSQQKPNKFRGET